jgi:hypothetical protein
LDLPSSHSLFCSLSGGNQRDEARKKAEKKKLETSKGQRKDDGLSAAARKERLVVV